MATSFQSFHVRRFRSLLDVRLDISDTSPVIICGENNIGKTNFLRALNVFFNHFNDDDIFNPKEDIPHHIYYGSQGAGSKTELEGVFDLDGAREIVKVIFGNDGNATYSVNGNPCDADRASETLSRFKYLFVESHNIDLPKLISTALEKEGLLPLDRKRKSQSQPLKKLEEFIKLSQKAIASIEKDINRYFNDLTDFDGILQNKKIKISFAEFDKLRDAVKNMTSITLFDGNNHGIASKGSGAQRAVFLSLMQFISSHIETKEIIWGIDEPEAFLQPSLQKRVAEVLRSIVSEKKQPIIVTTHSQNLIQINNLAHTFLFKGEISPRTYTRKPGQTFYEVNTKPLLTNSDYEKAAQIREHLGISANDNWEVLPKNIVVEGEEDKRYLQVLFGCLNLPCPNIIYSGGASKIGGYLQFYNMFSEELSFTPEFICIFDNDEEGREQSKKVKPTSYRYLIARIENLPRYDGAIASTVMGDWEMEDFIPPEILIPFINKILRKEQYKQIRGTQIAARSKPAHMSKQILKYAEECCSQNNNQKIPLGLDNQGRKIQLCQKFCDGVDPVQLATALTHIQRTFLAGLV
jgi:predicted ATP-dependent endonuclease of OLD family